MKKLSTTTILLIITILLILLTALNLAAQEAKPGNPIGGIIVKGGKNPGGSISFTANAGSSTSAGANHSTTFNPNLGIELFWGDFGLGLDAGLLGTRPDFDLDSYIEPFKNMGIATVTGTQPQNSYNKYLLVGPQYTFRRINIGKIKWANKIGITVGIKGGITGNATGSYAVTDNGSQSLIAGYTPSDAYKKNIFTVKPGLTIGYDLSEKFSVNLGAQYQAQVNQQGSAIIHRDLSAVNFNMNAKEVAAQILNSPVIRTSTNGADKYFSAGFGLKYTFRKGRKDVKPAQAAANNNPLYEHSGSEVQNPLYLGQALVAGSPIGGAVVKGGKNPGGNLFNLITDPKGEIELKDLKTGNYKFTITASETGDDPSQAAKPGNPIGGIIVKGGKNPGGSMFTIVTNAKGEFGFKVTEPGDYKFTVSIQKH